MRSPVPLPRPIRLIIRRLRKRKFDQGVMVDPTANINNGAILATRGRGTITIGPRSHIHHGAMLLTYGGTIKIGADCSVNPYSILYGHGGLEIGDGVRIAAHCTIIPANHDFADKSKPIYEQGQTKKGIVIEDDVWISTGVRILDGVRIRSGCVIAAGAVVTKSTEPDGVYAGVPARRIASR
jgi:acetyltransferase-like isoleucine patch superfamily enzyme